jgi:hypothetical protein
MSVDGGTTLNTTITTVPDTITNDLIIGKYGTSYDTTQLGEVQIVQGLNSFSGGGTSLATLYTSGIPASWTGATVAAHYRWATGIFLNDETGNNNLTGTNVTEVDDRISVYYPSHSNKSATIDQSGNETIQTIAVGRGTKILGLFTGSLVYDCGSIAAGVDSTFSVTCTGALAGNPVSLGVSVAAEAGLVITAECTANDIVKVRISNHFLVSAVDPASRTYRVLVTNF